MSVTFPSCTWTPRPHSAVDEADYPPCGSRQAGSRWLETEIWETQTANFTSGKRWSSWQPKLRSGFVFFKRWHEESSAERLAFSVSGDVEIKLECQMAAYVTQSGEKNLKKSLELFHKRGFLNRKQACLSEYGFSSFSYAVWGTPNSHFGLCLWRDP